MQNAADWAEAWNRDHKKPIVEHRVGDGKVPLTVLHVAPDGLVVDMGRTIAVVPPPRVDMRLEVGSKVTIDRLGHCRPLQQKSRGDGLER